MSLRKSPTLTPALLAANRANAQKCTGPRTPEAKSRVALNALRHGRKARSFFSLLAKSCRAGEEFSGLYRALYAALLPDKTDEAAMDLLKRAVLHVWAMKQEAIRWAASPTRREAWFARTGGVCPAPSHGSSARQGLTAAPVGAAPERRSPSTGPGAGFRTEQVGPGSGTPTGRGGLPPLPLFAPCSANTCRTGRARA